MTLRPYTLSATLLAVVLSGCAHLPGNKDDLAREIAATQSVPVKLPKPVSDEAPIKINKEDAAHKAAKASRTRLLQLHQQDVARKGAGGVVNEGQITLNYETCRSRVVQNILGAARNTRSRRPSPAT